MSGRIRLEAAAWQRVCTRLHSWRVNWQADWPTDCHTHTHTKTESEWPGYKSNDWLSDCSFLSSLCRRSPSDDLTWWNDKQRDSLCGTRACRASLGQQPTLRHQAEMFCCDCSVWLLGSLSFFCARRWVEPCWVRLGLPLWFVWVLSVDQVLLSKTAGMRIDIGSKNQSVAVESTFLFLLLVSACLNRSRVTGIYALDQTGPEGGDAPDRGQGSGDDGKIFE